MPRLSRMDAASAPFCIKLPENHIIIFIMKEKGQGHAPNKRRQRFSLTGFLLGLLLGFFFSFGGGFLVARNMLHEGLQIKFDAETIALLVRDQVEREAARELPAVIKDLEGQIPARVSKQLSSRLESATISLYGVSINLPSPAIDLLKKEIEALVIAEFRDTLTALDLEGMARKWGLQAESMVRAALRDELNGRTFTVYINRWLPLAITVNVPAGS